MRRRTTIWLLLLATMAAACGGDTTDGRRAGPVGPEPATCTGSWQSLQVLPQSASLTIRDMGWLGDRMYYRHTQVEPPFAMQLATWKRGGSHTSQSAPDHYHFTTDGIAFASIGAGPTDAMYELWTKQPDATDWTLDKTFGFADPRPLGFTTTFAVTADAIYGGASIAEAFVVSRFDRATGVEQRLASFRISSAWGAGKDSAEFFGKMVVSADWLFFYSDGGTFSLPTTGGAPVFMPHAYGNTRGPLGVSSSGKVFFQGFEGEGTVSFFALGQVGTSTEPARIRTDLPKQFVANVALDDGRGGWILGGTQRLADGARHFNVFALDAAGRSRRLACDPEVGRTVLEAAASPDGVYLAPFQLEPIHHEVVFVPRP